MCQGFNHFSCLLYHFVFAKLATSSIRIKGYFMINSILYTLVFILLYTLYYILDITLYSILYTFFHFEYQNLPGLVPGFYSFFLFACLVIYTWKTGEHNNATY